MKANILGFSAIYNSPCFVSEMKAQNWRSTPTRNPFPGVKRPQGSNWRPTPTKEPMTGVQCPRRTLARGRHSSSAQTLTKWETLISLSHKYPPVSNRLYIFWCTDYRSENFTFCKYLNVFWRYIRILDNCRCLYYVFFNRNSIYLFSLSRIFIFGTDKPATLMACICFSGYLSNWDINSNWGIFRPATLLA